MMDDMEYISEADRALFPQDVAAWEWLLAYSGGDAETAEVLHSCYPGYTPQQLEEELEA